MDTNLSKLLEIVKGREAWRAAVHGVTKGHHKGSPQRVSTKGHHEGSPRRVSTKGHHEGSARRVSTKGHHEGSARRVTTKGHHEGSPRRVSTKGQHDLVTEQSHNDRHMWRNQINEAPWARRAGSR